MLIVTRKDNEQIIVGDDIVITILENGGNRCRIGIDAPKEVRIRRGELAKKPVLAKKSGK